MNLTTQAAPAPQRIRQIAPLVIGDTIALIAFAAIGRNTHAEAAGLDALPQILETAAPFLVGWFVSAVLLGAYRSGVIHTPGRMVGRTALAWLLAWPISLGLRALIRQSSISISFAIVTLVTVLAIMVGWRLVFAFTTRRTAQ